MKKPKPLFIAIEGGEGSGKSTLLKTLKEAFNDVMVTTREPGGSPYAEAIRESALKHPLAKDAPAETMICLMFAARFDHIKNLVVPALKRGTHVVTDRFDASSYAYQIHGQKSPVLEKLFWQLRGQLIRVPDLYIYIDVDVEEGLRRARRRNSTVSGEGNHFDDQTVDFHKRLRKGYKLFFKKVPYLVIDANKSLEAVKADFIATLRKHLH